MAKGGGFAIRLKNKGSSGITEATGQKPLLVYVDKASDTLHIESDKVIESVRINDISGQLMLTKNFGNASFSEQIDLANMNKGFYVVSVKTETTQKSTTFIHL